MDRAVASFFWRGAKISLVFRKEGRHEIWKKNPDYSGNPLAIYSDQSLLSSAQSQLYISVPIKYAKLCLKFLGVVVVWLISFHLCCVVPRNTLVSGYQDNWERLQCGNVWSTLLSLCDSAVRYSLPLWLPGMGVIYLLVVCMNAVERAQPPCTQSLWAYVLGYMNLCCEMW